MMKEDSGQLTSTDYDEKKVNNRSTVTRASEKRTKKITAKKIRCKEQYEQRQ